ncbi:hypothetical protein [Tolypothrix sp. PCC 7601]|uniref:hypothetical protein n=1 Tax=Tolypothrix sp. PCC 7601 TaxID=1188 RepID=UPI0005EAA694|nr:hypothetical protein [Tolypothrix sp. PCC 7601]EKE98958.1 hypothetical protein FDUTEX481_03146 [Tolypothrix sp. PCC 7601]UYD35641.1 hypothetical protein HG267_07725 [Tolypothrix sp. PCC 7601]BAY94795.1 hypothetical protein NIES3275_68490 [Microchaete diplosiphon NIES-3275]
MPTRVAGVENTPHVVGTGDNRVLLVLPDVYSSVGAALGVVKLVGDPPAGVPSTTVGRAVADGLIRKIRISYIGSNGKRKVSSLIVAGDKAMQARASLIGSTYQSHKILTAYYPTRIQLG